MSLDAIDHFILRHNMGAAADVRELQRQLADQAGAHQGYRAILHALLSAHEASDWATIEDILGKQTSRNALYQAAYFPTYNSLNPG